MLLFITWLLETLLLFVVPIIYSLKNLEDRQSYKQRWIYHWMLVLLVPSLLNPVFGVFPQIMEFVFRLVQTCGILFFPKFISVENFYQGIQFGQDVVSQHTDIARQQLGGLMKQYSGQESL